MKHQQLLNTVETSNSDHVCPGQMDLHKHMIIIIYSFIFPIYLFMANTM